jgi:thermitase
VTLRTGSLRAGAWILLLLVCAAAGIFAVRSALFGAPNAAISEPWALVRVSAARGLENFSHVVVGVVDSGVNAAHPALRGRVLSGIDLVDGGPGTEDPLGHGTQVAGIIAAGDGVGVAQNARILPVRVLDAKGSGTVTRLAEGIRWAADNEARVINASVETTDPRRRLRTAVEYAWARTAVVVAISGNAAGAVQWPAAYGHVLAVGATDARGRHAAFSGKGRQLDLVAPGVGIRTTAAGGGYTEATGTSVAAPFVSGAAALLLGQEPGLTAEDVVRRLRTSARDLGRPGFDTRFGAGLLDVAAALEG